MILTQQQVDEILDIVEFHHLFVISTNFGKSVLSIGLLFFSIEFLWIKKDNSKVLV